MFERVIVHRDGKFYDFGLEEWIAASRSAVSRGAAAAFKGRRAFARRPKTVGVLRNGDGLRFFALDADIAVVDPTGWSADHFAYHARILGRLAERTRPVAQRSA